LKEVLSKKNVSMYLDNVSLSIKDGKLLINGKKISELLLDYSTPLYVFSEDQIRENCQNLKRLLRNNFNKFDIYYSYKTNYLDDVCRIVSEEGLGAEVVSVGELTRALKWSPIKVIFSGIYKPDYILEKIIRNKINTLIISSLNELSRINKFLKKYQQKQNIAIRIKNPVYGNFSGIEYDEENFLSIIKLLSNYECLNLTMLHYHAGTQIIDNKIRLKNINFILNVYEKFEKHGYKIPELNLGGGFPEAGILSNKNLNEYFNTVKEKIQNNWNDLKIVFEPGRYIIGNTGFLIIKVHDSLRINNEDWILVDAGDHILPKASKSNFRFIFIDKMDKPHKRKLSIKGCLPTNIDILAKNYPAPENVKKDDIILVANAGAYTLTWSYRFSFPEPPIILMNKSEIKELRPRGNENKLYY